MYSRNDSCVPFQREQGVGIADRNQFFEGKRAPAVVKNDAGDAPGGVVRGQPSEEVSVRTQRGQ